MDKLNKRILFSLFTNLGIMATLNAQVTPPAAYDQGIKKNYVREWSPTAPITNQSVVPTRPVEEVNRTTSYLDGLGRPLQSVSRQVSPSKKDLVSAMVYDDYGRESYKYLPFISTTGDGDFKFNPFQQQSAFMTTQYGTQGETWFYSRQKFEPSPLERPTMLLSQGNSWVGSNRGTSVQYLNNTAEDSVQVWNINDANASIPTSAGVYDTGTLIKSVTIDEHEHKVVEYKDKLGKVILKKVQLAASPGLSYTGWLCTYYIYDAFENLRFVIQPKAVVMMVTAGNWAITTAMRDELCFYYSYDERNRMIIKKVPGAAEVYMVYDARDRLVMTQDGNLRTGGKWMITTYDLLNRPVQMGLLTDATSFATHRSNASTSINYPSTAANFELLTQNFYDDYSWVASSGTALSSTLDATNTTNSSYFITIYNATPYFALPLTANYATKGMATGSMVKVLGNSNHYLYTVSFYNDKGKIIQTQSINISGGRDINTTQYDFSGKPLRSLLQHQKSSTNAQTHTILTKMEYDHAGRLLLVKKALSSVVGGQTITVPEKTILQNIYDELGQLKNKKIGTYPNSNTELESLNYDYNIRGWLLGMNRSFITDFSAPVWGAGAGNNFGFELGYDKTAAASGITTYTTQQYNGNISGTVWKSKGDQELRKYDFSYDNVNRIAGADFNQLTSGSFSKSANIDFSVSGLDYDANGNILHMNQVGLKVNASSFIDQMAYTYIPNSNKLLNVFDASNDQGTLLGDFRFKDSHPQYTAKTANSNPSSVTDYEYDINGNMVKDYNKDIKGTGGANGIIYNHLNLPQLITIVNKGSIEYTYDAGGNKLKKTVHENGRPDKTTAYINGFVYENDTLQFFGHEEGRVRFKPAVGNTAAGLAFDYFLKDHLGNVRMVLTEEQQQDMYPAATMETATAATEETYYSNLPTTRIAAPVGYPANTPSGNVNVARVSGGTGNADHKIGPAIVLKVMAGDKFNVMVNSWYKTNGQLPQSPNSIVNALLDALNTGVSSLGGSKVTQQQLQAANAFGGGVNHFLTNQNNANNANKPKAYLNWILFDEQFKYVESNSGFEQVGNNEEYKTHVKTNMPVDKNGFLYIYVSNETPNIAVFFDNLQVTHTRGQILEETHYYPFGLTMSGISSKAAGTLENKRKFNKGSELQDKEFSDGSGLEWYATNFRSLDPQIGRWWQIDPKPDYSQSLYSAMNNNPISFNDPLGDTVRRKGFSQNKIVNNISKGLKTDKKTNPFSFDKKGNLQVNQSKYDKLSPAQQEIASKIKGNIESDVTFTITKGKSSDVLPLKTADGKTVTLGGVGGAATYQVGDKNVVTMMTNAKFFDGAGTDKYNSSQNLSSPDYLVMFHEMGHEYYRYVAKDPQQGGRAIEYENKVRTLNDLGTRDYDTPYHAEPINFDFLKYLKF